MKQTIISSFVTGTPNGASPTTTSPTTTSPTNVTNKPVPAPPTPMKVVHKNNKSKTSAITMTQSSIESYFTVKPVPNGTSSPNTPASTSSIPTLSLSSSIMIPQVFVDNNSTLNSINQQIPVQTSQYKQHQLQFQKPPTPTTSASSTSTSNNSTFITNQSSFGNDVKFTGSNILAPDDEYTSTTSTSTTTTSTTLSTSSTTSTSPTSHVHIKLDIEYYEHNLRFWERTKHLTEEQQGLKMENIKNHPAMQGLTPCQITTKLSRISTNPSEYNEDDDEQLVELFKSTGGNWIQIVAKYTHHDESILTGKKSVSQLRSRFRSVPVLQRFINQSGDKDKLLKLYDKATPVKNWVSFFQSLREEFVSLTHVPDDPVKRLVKSVVFPCDINFKNMIEQKEYLHELFDIHGGDDFQLISDLFAQRFNVIYLNPQSIARWYHLYLYPFRDWSEEEEAKLENMVENMNQNQVPSFNDLSKDLKLVNVKRSAYQVKRKFYSKYGVDDLIRSHEPILLKKLVEDISSLRRTSGSMGSAAIPTLLKKLGIPQRMKLACFVYFRKFDPSYSNIEMPFDNKILETEGDQAKLLKLSLVLNESLRNRNESNHLVKEKLSSSRIRSIMKDQSYVRESKTLPGCPKFPDLIIECSNGIGIVFETDEFQHSSESADDHISRMNIIYPFAFKHVGTKVMIIRFNPENGDIGRGIDDTFKEVNLFLKETELVDGAKYVAYSQYTSHRFQYYLTSNNLGKHIKTIDKVEFFQLF
ncbi:hypothetical protein DFA_10558 [Cavenderia fasciculata]|uniref:Myb-like domain-containing protein n=1 Tax=Cavenderia fasciculata TaxID=261658 RepID=F4QAJ7_CACFS|nr:uncharacterized protein DFA_10558 [Cavenderia fasciculata]EGG15716.1 hypothetical protein DFA_10558 [Cavenderia fasciculata]|eukprot:XP_004354458.1 hypothetical protein DFA_10558 [Cavenderia fasciculata]